MSIKGKKQLEKLTSAEIGMNVTLLSINAYGDVCIPSLCVFPYVQMNNELKKIHK